METVVKRVKITEKEEVQKTVEIIDQAEEAKHKNSKVEPKGR